MAIDTTTQTVAELLDMADERPEQIVMTIYTEDGSRLGFKKMPLGKTLDMLCGLALTPEEHPNV